MSPLEDLSDDVVAEQLKKEARENSIKYSAVGIDAFLPKRPANPSLKPNTRFLKNIIKEANSHNAALRNRDSLRVDSDSLIPNSSLRPNTGHHDARANSRDRKPSDNSGANVTNNKSQTHRRRSSDGHEHHHHRRRHRDDRRHRSRRSRSRSSQDRHDRERNRQRGEDRSESPNEGIRSSRKRSRRHRHRRRSKSPRSDRKHRARHEHYESGSERFRQHGTPSAEPRKTDSRNEHEDSDPLGHIIDDPSNCKAPIPRGRGANKSRSHIDEHFSTSYNPANDVQPDSADDDDWGQALEALKDRQRWKDLGAKRLREAGCSEGEISKWERGGDQREEDLRWKRSGEGREWDQGKVVTAAGEVETAVNWSK